MTRISALAYIVAECTEVARWRSFGEQVLGMQAREAGDGGLHLKMDERDFRIAIEPGARNAYAASGWEVRDAASFERIVDALTHSGAPHEFGSPKQCASRRMQHLLLFRDPAGNRHELGYGWRSDFSRFVSPVGVPQFVTGALGMGHTVLPAPNFDECCRFYEDVLGFGLADTYRHRYAPDAPVQRIHFTHCDNGRHHSLALFEGEVPSGCVHAMVELPNMDEVGRAYDRMLHHGAKLMATLGRHVNDEMISFYVETPSGFAIEIGCGGKVVDWTTHSVFETTAVSLWGHDFSVGFRG